MSLARHSWKTSDQPAWLTAESFSKKILSNVPMATIRLALGISNWYASKIRQGYRPYPRHWLALAELASLSSKRTREN